MHLKDYYKTLELEPSATVAEIKQAYRRLALLHHPDKNNDPYAIAMFTEIKEAYEVLTNPSRKEQYLQQRWYNQSIGKKKTQGIVTPVSVLKEALDLERYVSRLDTYRMDKQGLFEYINTQFDDATIEKLNSFAEQEVNDRIIEVTLKSLRVLKVEKAALIAERLAKLANPASKLSIEEAMRVHRKRERWEDKEVLVIFLITFAICLLIWLSMK